VSLYGLSVFCAVYALAVASPGPGVAAIVARALAHGTRGAPAFIAGFVVGDLLWFVMAALGLSALAQSAYAVFVTVKYAGAAYLLYLAYRLWTVPAQSVTADQVERPAPQKSLHAFLGSLALTLGNPKTMVFFLALLPTVIDLETLTVAGFLELAAAIAVVVPTVLGLYTLAAAKARGLFRSPRALRVVNRGTGVAMAGAAVTVATQ